MNSPHYSAHQRTTRAASANHTEAGASKSDRIPAYIPATPRPFAFQEGDEVVVSDEDHILNGTTGKVTNRWAGVPHRYTVKFHWSDTAIQGFRETQLRKVQIKSAPSALLVIDMPKVKPMAARKRPNIFFCEWGKFDLDKCPEIPRRFMEHKTRQMKKKPITQPVICLPAVCDSTRKEQAHIKYLKFRGLLRLIADLDELPIALPSVESETSWLDMIDQQEYEKEAKKAAQSKTAGGRRRAKPTKAVLPTKTPKITNFPQLRIRSYGFAG